MDKCMKGARKKYHDNFSLDEVLAPFVAEHTAFSHHLPTGLLFPSLSVNIKKISLHQVFPTPSLLESLLSRNQLPCEQPETLRKLLHCEGRFGQNQTMGYPEITPATK